MAGGLQEQALALRRKVAARGSGDERPSRLIDADRHDRQRELGGPHAVEAHGSRVSAAREMGLECFAERADGTVVARTGRDAGPRLCGEIWIRCCSNVGEVQPEEAPHGVDKRHCHRCGVTADPQRGHRQHGLEILEATLQARVVRRLRVVARLLTQECTSLSLCMFRTSSLHCIRDCGDDQVLNAPSQRQRPRSSLATSSAKCE